MLKLLSANASRLFPHIASMGVIGHRLPDEILSRSACRRANNTSQILPELSVCCDPSLCVTGTCLGTREKQSVQSTDKLDTI
jgi:hypothetical protein